MVFVNPSVLFQLIPVIFRLLRYNGHIIGRTSAAPHKVSGLLKGRHMAKLKALTTTKLNEFKSTAKDRQEIAGDVPGLFYIKLGVSGAWRLRYTDPEGTLTPEGKPKRITVTIGTPDMKPAEAAELANDWRKKIKAGINPKAEISRANDELRKAREADQRRRFVNLGTFFIEIYTPHLNDTASGRSTLANIKLNFSHLFDRDMDGLNVADIRAWEKTRKKDDIHRDTLLRALAALKGMLSYATGKKKNDTFDAPVIKSSPLAGVSLSKPTEAEQEAAEIHKQEKRGQRRELAPDHKKALQHGLDAFAEQIRAQRRSSIKHGKAHLPSLDSATYPHWFIPFCHIARLTGMRSGDILRLRWTNIQQDFRNKCQAVNFIPHKTAHHNKRREVFFPITGELSEVLSAWREQNGNPDNGLMFPSRASGAVMDKNAYHRHWASVKTLGGLPEDLQFYALRHNFITERVNAGWPLLAIAKLVGHADTSMIAENYFNPDGDNLAALMMSMEKQSKTGKINRI